VIKIVFLTNLIINLIINMAISFNEQYWTNRYLNLEIGWDVGEITKPIKQYLDQLQDQRLKILIPGAGNSYEAAYAHNLGFKEVHVLDFAKPPLVKFLEKHPNFPKDQVYCIDFFEHTGQYDLIIEQTFFCALSPSLRNGYALKMHQLLKPNGKIIGVLFNREFDNQGPPFGGTKVEYIRYFDDLFFIEKMEDCFNSITPRHGSELFISLTKKPES